MKKRQMQPSRSAVVIEYEVSPAPPATRLPYLSERWTSDGPLTDLLRRGPGVCSGRPGERMKAGPAGLIRLRLMRTGGGATAETPPPPCTSAPPMPPAAEKTGRAELKQPPCDMKSNTQTGCLIDFHTRGTVVCASAAKHQGMRRLGERRARHV